ncbi:TetR family transcriptional regulator [Nannocystis pusilla]|uniref:TetR/AcrR family transcriptional regulator n=1 Tax=Nannocystis pusilla TaxID=889268 RepID=A0ABS7TWS2_9BACT|nr:TetR family transcriptional regulator [Nannocystis pusilla]MBZ5712653.1 TetR/AcrR family transcriptional regulator [Nannocystis pusilla]
MQTASKRGRPQEADPRRIARIALRLFVRKGFDRVTVGEIAEAASVSRRTLFRLFPSKSELVWDGLDEVRDVVRQRAASLAGVGLGVGEVLREFAEPFLRRLDAPAAAETARQRLRLLAAAPALFNHPPLREIEAVIATTLAGSASPGDTPPPLVARSLVAATFAALIWWAEHGEGMTALEATRAAFRALAGADQGASSTAATSPKPLA